MERPYDCDDYSDTRFGPVVSQVQVLVTFGGEDWRVIFHREGGIQVSVSMEVNGSRDWFVPTSDQGADQDRVVGCARAQLDSWEVRARGWGIKL